MPSVISLTSVRSLTLSVNRTLKPTASPSSVPSSSAIRSATVRAASRRGWVCPIMPCTPRPELETDLRDLGRLAGPGLTRDDHDLVIADRGRDLVLQLADRQLLRIRDLRHGRPPYLDAPLGLLDRADHTLQRLGPLPRVLASSEPARAAARAAPGRTPVNPSSRATTSPSDTPSSAVGPVGGLARRRTARLRSTPATRPTTYGGVLDGTGGWGRTRRLGPGIRHNPSSLGGRPQPLTRITKGAPPAP